MRKGTKRKIASIKGDEQINEAELKEPQEKNGDNPDIDDNKQADARKKDLDDAGKKLVHANKKKGKNRVKKAKLVEMNIDQDDDDSNNEIIYEVDKILKSRSRKGVQEFLVRWKGFSKEDDSWEPEENLNCPELLQGFIKSNNSANGSETSSKKGKKEKGLKTGKQDATTTRESDVNESEDDEKEYEVEKILEVHHKKNGKKEFLVRWKGYSKNDDSWEPEENLNCAEMISAFLKKVDKAREATQRETRVNRKQTDRFVLQSPDSGRKLSARTRGARRTYYEGDD